MNIDKLIKIKNQNQIFFCKLLRVFIAFALTITTVISLDLKAQDGGGWKNPLSSPEGMASFRKKAEKKEGSRWTLREWMEQKEKNRFMDLWLGMNAPSPYEFILSGEYLDYSSFRDDPQAVSASQTQRVYHSVISVAFYALILGLEAQYENNSVESYQETRAQVNLRVAGNAAQGTHLILFYGHKSRNLSGLSEKMIQNYAGADLDLYIERHSGLHGNYRYDIPAQHNNLGEIRGSKIEGGIFFDWLALRFFSNYFQEIFQTTSNGVSSLSSTITTTRKGFSGGLKIYL